MKSKLSEDISANDYRVWVRQSNEELIPRPLSLYFRFPWSDPPASYWDELIQEIKIQASLFDADRKVMSIAAGGTDISELSPRHCRKLLDQIRLSFQVVCQADQFLCRSILQTFEICDQVGHGLAAISCISGNYCQNTSDYDDYRAELYRSELPVDNQPSGVTKIAQDLPSVPYFRVVDDGLRTDPGS